jgi:methyl-accepting chemotaxis protein
MASMTSFPNAINDAQIEPKRMQWLLNVPTRTKLMLGFGLMLLFLLAVIVAAYIGMNTLRNRFHQLLENEYALSLDLRALRANQNGLRASTVMLLHATGEQQETIWQDIETRRIRIDEVMTTLLERTDDPGLRTLLAEIGEIHDAFAETNEAEIIPLIDAGSFDEAAAIILGVQEERNDQTRMLTEQVMAGIDARTAAALAEVDQQTYRLLASFVLVGVLALITGIALALLLERAIANPLRAISGVAARIGAGDLTVDLPPMQRTDEVGLLSQIFRRMIDALRELNREVRDSVGVLTGSTGEIVAATTQLAVGTAETATAVSQTTTTVEEVRQVAEVASQKAKHVLDSAQKSLQVTQAGKKSVEETIDGMQRIQGQMELIADSIVRLSEQGQAIGEIIASVTDLAEQSNLLAVNAAIEAAKAGEHGRGFAVVAQEVKSLADQSKQATAQIRTILNDIQKATSSAVMAAEQGSRAVEAGVKQSTDTDEAIRQLAEVITEAAQAATQIAASSQQQLVGMSQVAQAMENINQAGSQNAASTRQAETIARDLHGLGQRLKQLVEQYQL